MSYSNIYPITCNVTQFILSGNCSTCFGWYHHPSSGAQTTVSTPSGICHTVTAICCHRHDSGKPYPQNSELYRDYPSVSFSDRFVTTPPTEWKMTWVPSRTILDLKFVILLRYWGSIIKEYQVSGTYADRRAKIFHRRTLTYSTPKKTHLGDGMRNITTNSNASPNDS
jgi:hypothetical protein